MRPAEERDLPALASLYERVYGPVPGGGARRFLAERLFNLPWPDPELPPLVYEDRGGRVAGLLGVIARPMLFRGAPIRVALAHHFMVAPETRATLASVALTRTLLAGPQDLTVAEACAPWRELWAHIGGGTSLADSLTWIRVLRPVSLACGVAARLARRRAVPRLLLPPMRAGDRLTARVCGPVAPPPDVPRPWRVLDTADLIECLHRLRVGSLQPVWNRHSLGYVLERLRQQSLRGTLFAIEVGGDGAAPAGCYVYFLKPAGLSQLVLLTARRGRTDEVVRHFLRHAWANGAGAAAGQVDRATWPALAEGGAFIVQRRDGWRLVHSRRPDILEAVHGGDAALTRLESEWWLTR
ncbi:MAG TPA: hypothetical protein VF198_08015 [Vicinamibacterales bacterium]